MKFGGWNSILCGSFALSAGSAVYCLAYDNQIKNKALAGYQ